MVQFNTKMKVSPEMIEKLSGESGKLWSAAHVDSSDSRVDLNALNKFDPILFPELNFASLGIEAVKKLIHNSGKTQQDYIAEEDATRINKTCGALEEMLLEYFQAAQKGIIDEESLDELIDTLDEIRGYYAFGKMKVPGEKELAEILESITTFTVSLAKEMQGHSVPETEASNADPFTRIRDRLIQQRKLIGKADRN